MVVRKIAAPPGSGGAGYRDYIRRTKVKKICLSCLMACHCVVDSALKFINYFRIPGLGFSFAAIGQTPYYRRGAAMNMNVNITKFSILQAFRPVVLAGLLASMLPVPANSILQVQEARKVRTKVDPEYPELARRLNLKGIVRVQVFIAAGGSVITVKELGGNPVLLDALVRAVKKWKYEPTDKDSVLEVKFDFDGT
jgi:TonB family protein